MPEPIIEFADEAQAYECLREWQTRLFLDDWIIKLELVEQHEMPDTDCDGYNRFFKTTKASKIFIAKKAKDDADCLIKHCEEHRLVHELLHCKYNWLEIDGHNFTAAYFDVLDHALLEQMAKSLIMAKYGVGLDWFRNF